MFYFYFYIYVNIYLFIYLLTYLFTYLFIYLFIFLCIHLFIYLSIHLLIYSFLSSLGQHYSVEKKDQKVELTPAGFKYAEQIVGKYIRYIIEYTGLSFSPYFFLHFYLLCLSIIFFSLTHSFSLPITLSLFHTHTHIHTHSLSLSPHLTLTLTLSFTHTHSLSLPLSPTFRQESFRFGRPLGLLHHQCSKSKRTVRIECFFLWYIIQ